MTCCNIITTISVIDIILIKKETDVYRVDNLTNRGVIGLMSKVPILQQH
jgi:hypothetical protein